MATYLLLYNTNIAQWEAFGNENAGRVITQTINDTLDSGTVVIETSSKVPFKQFTLARFMFTTIAYANMVVASDDVKQYQKGTTNTWVHTISLVEPTKILEKILVGNLLLTNATDTLIEQFEKAVYNTVLKYNDINIDKVFLTIDSSITAAIGNAKGEDFAVAQNTPSRAIYDELLSTVNCRVKATISPPQMIITLSAVNLNAEVENTKSYDVLSEDCNNDIESYGGSMRTSVSNAITRTLVKQPRSSFKTKESTLTTENATMMFSYSIEEIEKVNFYLGDIIFQYYADGEWNDYTAFQNYAMPLDITENFVDIEVYNLMSEDEKAENIPYTRGSSDVLVRTGEIPFWGFFGFSGLVEAVRLSFLRYAQANISDDIEFVSYKFDPTVKTLVETTLYEAEYYPMIDTTLIALKPSNYSGYTAELGIINNQGSGTVDIARLGSNLLGQIIKSGNNEYYLDSVYDSQSNFVNVMPLLSRIGDYVIHSRDISIMDTPYSTFYKVRYYLSENYNNLNERININREKRIYNIPVSGAETDLVDKNYIYASTEKPAISWAIKSMLPTNALTACVNTLRGVNKHTASITPTDFIIPDRMIITAYNGTVEAGNEIATHELPIARYGTGNTIAYKAKYYDNYSAGISIGGFVIGGKRAVFNPYTNDIGETAGFKFFVANNQSGETLDYNDYKTLPTTNISYYASADKTTNDTTLYYIKDRAQQISIVQNFYIIPAEADKTLLVIGNKFAENNNLVNGASRTLKIKITSEKYTVDDRVFAKGSFLSGNTDDKLSITYLGNGIARLSYIGAEIATAHNSWAICDLNNSLYFAVNSNINEVKDIYFYTDKVLH